MKKLGFSPFKVFILGFLCLGIIRFSMVLDETGLFEAQAEEKDLTKVMQKATAKKSEILADEAQKLKAEEKKAEKEEEKEHKEAIDEIINSDKDPNSENIQQKLTKPSDKNNQGKEFNPYAFEEVKTLAESDPKTACVTGPMLVAAKERLEFLEKREAEIKEQQRLIEIADRRVREQVAKLQLIKDKIVEQAQLADSKIAKESKRLITIYEKMKPKEAANIFNEMSPKVAAELLRSMKEDQSSAILAKMLPKIAYEVTLALAGGIKETQKDYKKLKE